MIKKVQSTTSYQIPAVKRISKLEVNLNKEREKQNEEKRQHLLKQKAFIESLRKTEKAEKEKVKTKTNTPFKNLYS